jgi:hypothetical protein
MSMRRSHEVTDITGTHTVGSDRIGLPGRLAVDQHPRWVGALAEHAVVNRQQIPGRRDLKASQGLLHRQAGRHRPRPALD